MILFLFEVFSVFGVLSDIFFRRKGFLVFFWDNWMRIIE